MVEEIAEALSLSALGIDPWAAGFDDDEDE
jgi:hypothetical protein